MSHDNEECCRDELFAKLIDYGIDSIGEYGFEEEIAWFLEWARRRESQVAGWLAEVLRAIATEDFNTVDEVRAWAAAMHERYLGAAPEKKSNPLGEGAVIDATE